MKVKQYTERRYYIVSSQVVRGRFCGGTVALKIESISCIGCLIALREDECRIHAWVTGQENFAVLRHIALNLLRQSHIYRIIKSKRRTVLE